MTFEEICRAFDAKMTAPDKGLAHCPTPGHGNGAGDTHPSLSIKAGRDGCTLMKCQAGCSTEDVLAAKGLTMKDLFLDGDKPRNGKRTNGRAARRAVAGESGLHLTDLGNSYRLVLHHGDDLRYVHTWRRWLTWGGGRWKKDDTGAVMRLAAEVPRILGAEAEDTDDPKQRMALRSHANATESAARQAALVELAKHNVHVVACPEDFDCDPLLFNVANGTIDLRTGELRPHRRDDAIMKLAPIDYDPNATCPRWDRFLEEVLPAPDLRAFVQRAVGYCLTGDTSEQIVFIAHGAGENGKSVFIETIKSVLGEYAQSAAKETFTTTRDSDKVPNDLASMVGARLISVIETDQGRRLDEALVKAVTGGDEVRCRFMRAEWFTYKPTFKPWLITNHKPQIRGADHAIWRRIRLVPFEVTIPPERRDKHLADYLARTETAGILRWAVEGSVAWQRGGLGSAPDVDRATAAYKAEQDHLSDFLAECCVALPTAFVSRAALRQRYDAWCAASGERPLGRNELNERLRLRFADEQLTTGSRDRGWRGVGLREQTNRSEPSFPDNRP